MRRALRQPQLRGPDPSRGQGELPRLAAAGRRVRARGADGHRPHDRAARARRRRRARVPRGHLAVARRGAGDDRERDRARHVPRDLRGRLRRARTRGASCRCRRASSSPGTPASTYVRRPPYFDGMAPEPGPIEDITGARCLVSLGDSVTTDHISPAGSIKADSPAGRYLVEHGVERATSTPTARGAGTTR